MPKDMAYYGQQDDSGFSISSGHTTPQTAPSTKDVGALAVSNISADQTLMPSSITANLPPSPSTQVAQSMDNGQNYQTRQTYTGPQTSSPLYNNPVPTLNPTAVYGTAMSSGGPWKNYTGIPLSTGSIGSPSVACNCPPPSAITIHDTITMSPAPVTITVTSTVTAESPPLVTPTITMTITTPVCAGNGQNTDSGGSTPPIEIPSNGGQETDAGYPTGAGGSGPTAPAVQTTPIDSDFVSSEQFPQSTGSGEVTSPYQPPYMNATGAPAPSLPVGTGGFQSLDTSQNVSPTDMQNPAFNYPNSPEQTQPPSSEDLASGGLVTTPVTTSASVSLPADNIPASSLDQGTGQSSGGQEQPQQSIEYPGATTSASASGVPAIPTAPPPVIVGTGSSGPEGTSAVTSVTPPYGFGNETLIGPNPATDSIFYGTNPVPGPAQTDTTNIISPSLPPFVNTTSPITSTLPLGTGTPIQPINTAIPNPETSAPPFPFTLSPAPFQTPLFPVAVDNNTGASSGVSVVGTAPPTIHPPITSGLVYSMVTKVVSPIPLNTGVESSSAKSSYKNFYGNGNSNTNPTSDPNLPSNTDSSSLPPSSNPAPNPSSMPPTPLPPLPPASGTPVPYAPPLSSPPVPSSSPPVPPPPPPPNPNDTTPTCPPHPADSPITADFNAFTLLNTPIPSPHLSLIYTGFSIDNGSPTPHLVSSPSESARSISIAPPAVSFNLSSISLACETPPCNVSMFGQSVGQHTAQGAAAGSFLTQVVQVEAASHGAGPFTVVGGLETKGWVELGKVGFVVQGDGGGGGLAVDDVVYWVSGGAEGEGGGGGC
ncbi:MAG: hypothetical protein Q9219_006609 [cf. Caloplaca sp. 3 TL-2023]